MSADLLREAAALMRERAEAAPAGSPWGVIGGSPVPGAISRDFRVVDNSHSGISMAVSDVYPSGGSNHQRAMAEHIASWHPAVALAVADWLEAVAAVHWQKRSDRPSESHYNAETEHVWFDGDCDESCWTEAYICNGCGTAECKPEISGRALAVASAYLGEA